MLYDNVAVYYNTRANITYPARTVSILLPTILLCPVIRILIALQMRDKCNANITNYCIIELSTRYPQVINQSDTTYPQVVHKPYCVRLQLVIDYVKRAEAPYMPALAKHTY